ncbi:MAG: peptidase [Mucilaginibacter sp.]|nr:peptidase [Mucilaginibacter sp.]
MHLSENIFQVPNMNFKKTIFLWAVTALVTTGGAFAQVKKKAAAPAARKTTTGAKQQAKPAAPNVLTIDPNVKIGKLPNGLTYYIRANSQPKGKAQLVLINKAGSVLETDAQRGMANFIQRMAFKGTRDFPKSQLDSYLTKLGIPFGPDTNAFTTYDETVYQLTVPTAAKELNSGFNLLANWAARITFDPAAVNTEKDLLATKAAAGGATAEDRLQQQTLPVILNSQYGNRLPIGAESTIKTFTAATAKSFYTEWYRPDLQAIIAVGDFDPKQVEELIKTNFGSLKNPVPEKPQPQYAPPATPGTTVKIATEKGFPYTLFQIIVKHPQAIVKTPSDILQSIRINIFNQIIGARITDLTKIPSAPITYGQSSYTEFTGKQDVFSTIAAPNGPEGLETAVKAVVGELERARKFGFTITELERAKQAALERIAGEYGAKSNIPSGSFAGAYEHNFLTKQAIPGIDYEYNYYVNNIGKISIEEMNALAAKLITDQNRVILLEAPDVEKDKLPSEQTLLKWVADAGNGLTAYVDESETPFMAARPKPGQVANLKTDSVLGVVNISLNNGVKVILKPTRFAQNQILISAYSPGGTSLASNQDFVSANFAAQVISNSGIASFNQTQVVKMMRDKAFSITPYIGDVTQGVSGYAVPGDLESAMQLLYLYFTNPRKDADVWQSYVSKAKTALAKSTNDPAAVYQDTVQAVLNGYAPRAMPLTEEKLNAASLDKAYSFFKDRFADASNFTFTFTGNFAVNEIVPYIATYLGSLPATHNSETFKNLGLHPPAGQITKTVYKGTNDKATVQLVYNGGYEFNEANNIQLDGLEEIMNIRLVDSLKDGNGIYSPSVRVSYFKNPEGRYKVTVAFLADANNVDKAVATMVGEINKIRQNGPVSKDVQLFITRDARNRQAQFKQNTFWQVSLSTASQNHQDPDKILTRIQELSQVTDQSMKDTANKYLGSNLIKIILMPEKK